MAQSLSLGVTESPRLETRLRLVILAPHFPPPPAGAIKLAALSLQPRLCSTLAASPSSAAACYHPALFISSKARHHPQHSFQKGRRGTRAGRCPAPNRRSPLSHGFTPCRKGAHAFERGAAAVRKHRHSQHKEEKKKNRLGFQSSLQPQNINMMELGGGSPMRHGAPQQLHAPPHAPSLPAALQAGDSRNCRCGV